MAQESWKETDETECETPKGPIHCANNCGFFGIAVTNNLCSKCHRDLAMKQQPVVAPPVPLAEKMHVVASSPPPLEPTSIELDKPDGTHVVNLDKKLSEDLCDKQPTNRCLVCRKKFGLIGFKCRCGGMFCPAHRYSETHECSFDYKSVGREAIARENPVVKAAKVVKI